MTMKMLKRLLTKKKRTLLLSVQPVAQKCKGRSALQKNKIFSHCKIHVLRLRDIFIFTKILKQCRTHKVISNKTSNVFYDELIELLKIASISADPGSQSRCAQLC